MTLKKIISGGQTGVDRAALDVAIKLNIPHGGWCPNGRLSETGVIPEKYHLHETASADYSERTKLNIRDSDGTLIIIPNTQTHITDGTVLTIQEVKDKQRFYLIVDLSNKADPEIIFDWLKKNNIKTLNVAGPRESQYPGMYKLSFEFLENTFTYILNKTYHLKAKY